jgi:hypothetical protein
MNAAFSVEFKRPAWQTVVMFALGFWLSSSLLLDFVIMPGLSAAGMMSQASAATAGYSFSGFLIASSCYARLWC